MIKGILSLVAVLAFLVVEVLVAQWLLGLFGWHFGFFTVLGIILAVQFLFGCFIGSRAK
jgi:hypothetical protein